jgi:hypothetical protein
VFVVGVGQFEAYIRRRGQETTGRGEATSSESGPINSSVG